MRGSKSKSNRLVDEKLSSLIVCNYLYTKFNYSIRYFAHGARVGAIPPG